MTALLLFLFIFNILIFIVGMIIPRKLKFNSRKDCFFTTFITGLVFLIGVFVVTPPRSKELNEANQGNQIENTKKTEAIREFFKDKTKEGTITKGNSLEFRMNREKASKILDRKNFQVKKYSNQWNKGEEFSKETEKLKESVTLSYKDGKVVSATMTVDNINLKSNKKEMFSKLEELVKMLEPSFGENVSKSLKTTLKNFPKESFSSPIVSDDFFVRTTNNSKIYSISTGKILPKKN